MQPIVKSEIVVPQAAASMPFDAELFRDRIYTRDSSYFAGETNLMVNEKEAKPENEPILTAKLLKHMSIMEPSFYSFHPRTAVAGSLVSYVHPSLKTRQEQTVKDLLDMYLEQKTGIHPEQQKNLARYGEPFKSQANFWVNPTEVMSTPAKEELKATALTLYLIVNEALKKRGRNQEASAYVDMADSPDDVISKLSPMLGVSALQITETLIKDGADGLAKLLNVEPHVVAEFKQLAETVKAHEFPNNMVDSWNIGRSIEGMKSRTLEEKMQVGLLVRTAKKLEELRGHEFPEKKPEDVKEVEDRVINVLRRMPLELQEALYYSGVEIALTPNKTVEGIYGSPVEALGLHSHAAYLRGEPGGVLQIYVGSMYEPDKADNTLVHEAHHFQAPKSYSQTDLQAIDALLLKNWLRMAELEKDCAAWARERSPEQRKAIESEIDKKFTIGDMTLAKALGGQVTEAGMQNLYYFVTDARRNLDPVNGGLSRGYHTPELRATEFISRVSEIKLVRGATKPEMLAFTAPDAVAIYDQFYLPHVRNELAKLKNNFQPQLPAYMAQFKGLSDDVLKASTQQPANPSEPGTGATQPQPQPGQQQQPAPLPHSVAAAASLKFESRPTRMVAAAGGDGDLSTGKAGKATRIQAQAERFTQRLEAIEEKPAQPAR